MQRRLRLQKDEIEDGGLGNSGASRTGRFYPAAFKYMVLTVARAHDLGIVVDVSTPKQLATVLSRLNV